MSGRYHDFSKGSSRSTRDDSRLYKDDYGGRDRKSRSRSPRRKSPARSCDYSYERSSNSRERDRREREAWTNEFSLESSSSSRDRDRQEYEASSSHYSSDRSSKSRNYSGKGYSKSNSWDNEEEVPTPPPPPRITKISIGFTKPKAPIKMNLGGPTKPAAKPTIASVFGPDDDDDEEPEEMPAEARMRMRNIGRETPTSAGPNSFGKTKQGFCDAKKVFEKNMKQALESNEKPPFTKLPQTIYRIKGP